MSNVIAYLEAELSRYYRGQHATVVVTFDEALELYTAIVSRPNLDDVELECQIGSDDDIFEFTHEGSTYLTVPLMPELDDAIIEKLEAFESLFSSEIGKDDALKLLRSKPWWAAYEASMSSAAAFAFDLVSALEDDKEA